MYPNLAAVASLIGDPARAAMLFRLLDGRECPASDLAFHGGASPQAASGHLRKLVSGGLVDVRAAGRQRLFRLASGDVAHAIETLAAIAPVKPASSLKQHDAMQRLREARSCYDHLAGRAGVAVTDAMIDRQFLVRSNNGFQLTASGAAFLVENGIDVSAARRSKRAFARACMDWTERRAHLAGSLGAAMLANFIERRWLERNERDRALQVTPDGRRELLKLFFF